MSGMLGAPIQLDNSVRVVPAVATRASLLRNVIPVAGDSRAGIALEGTSVSAETPNVKFPLHAPSGKFYSR
jgi:hypothetical protein